MFFVGAYLQGNTAPKTAFSRKVNISFVNSAGTTVASSDPDAHAIVKSYVIWSGAATVPANCTIGSKCIMIEDDLTKWDE